jgi:hypothetical protein
MPGEAPQEAEPCYTCGGDWDLCKHDWKPTGNGGHVLTGTAEGSLAAVIAMFDEPARRSSDAGDDRG